MAEDKVTGIVFIVALIGLIGYVFYKREIEPTILATDWTKVAIIASICIISLIFLVIVGYFSVKKVKRNIKEKKERKYELSKQKSELNELLETSFYGSSIEIEKKLEELKEKVKKFPEEIKNQSKIKKFYKKIERKIEDREQEEEIKKEEQRQQRLKKEREERFFNNKVQELIEFKIKKKSHKALPLKHNYSSQMIYKATEEARDYFREEQRKKEIRKEAIEYYKKNDIDTKPNLLKENEEIYAKVRKEIKNKKIKLKPEIVYEGEPLEKQFYRAKDIDEEIKRKAIAQGYEHVRGNELDGCNSAGGFYIKKNM